MCHTKINWRVWSSFIVVSPFRFEFFFGNTTHFTYYATTHLRVWTFIPVVLQLFWSNTTFFFFILDFSSLTLGYLPRIFVKKSTTLPCLGTILPKQSITLHICLASKENLEYCVFVFSILPKTVFFLSVVVEHCRFSW